MAASRLQHLKTSSKLPPMDCHVVVASHLQQVPSAKHRYHIAHQPQWSPSDQLEQFREEGVRLWSWQDLQRGGVEKVLADLGQHWQNLGDVAVTWDGTGIGRLPGLDANQALTFIEILAAVPNLRVLRLCGDWSPEWIELMRWYLNE